MSAAIPASLKILAIGNSFSVDAMQYLAQISLDLGMPAVTLGNLYIGGCSLERHLGNAQHDIPDYVYYKTSDGRWSEQPSSRLETALADEEWDIITMQQSSPLSGIPTSYLALSPLVEFVRARCPRARLVWHMTWAYAGDSTHRGYENYSFDQTTMYAAIRDTLPLIDQSGAFSAVIPVGTAIQNARTGFIGDTLNRDGFHLSYTAGRFLAGMTWFAALTGCSVEKLSYNPAPVEITGDVMALFKEAVANAIACPRKVTLSHYQRGEWGKIGVDADSPVLTPADCEAADRMLAAGAGIALDGRYICLPLDLKPNLCWQTSREAVLNALPETDGQYNKIMATSVRFSRALLPAQSVLICDGGWQCRALQWKDPCTPSCAWAGLTQAGVYILDENWWGESTLCAFQLASSPKTDLSLNFPAAASHLRIYVPHTSLY